MQLPSKLDTEKVAQELREGMGSRYTEQDNLVLIKK
jgi:hypothetical protein